MQPKFKLIVPTPAQLAPFVLCAFGVSNILSPGGLISLYLIERSGGWYVPLWFGVICIACGVLLALLQDKVMAYWLCNLPIVFYTAATVLFVLETGGQLQPAVIYSAYVIGTASYVYHFSHPN